jgi:hypothetical protein
MRLQKLVLKRDQVYDLIDQNSNLNEIELTCGFTEKEVNNLEKRLYDYEISLR